jgi:hypothetical protein
VGLLSANKGEGIFKGRIRIPGVAQLTDSDQQCRSILMGDSPRVVVMPTLEVRSYVFVLCIRDEWMLNCAVVWCR